MDLYELMEDACMEGIITLECPKCGACITTEPDNVGYCDYCKIEVSNPLLEGGYI